MSKGKVITGEKLEYFLNLKSSDINKQFIINTFSKKIDKSDNKLKFYRNYEVFDELTIPKGKYHDNKEPIKTYLGLFIFNKFFIEDELYHILGYINEPINADKFEDIEGELCKALMNDKITTVNMITFLNKIQWFGFSFNSVLCPSMTPKTSMPLKTVEKEKKRLLEENKEEIEKGNVLISAQIQNKLLDIAKKEIGDDPGMDLYKSGSKASFGNNYSSLFVMKGPIKDNTTGNYHISTSNYIDGIKKDEIQYHGDGLVLGAYARGKNTQSGGLRLCHSSHKTSLIAGKSLELSILNYNSNIMVA